MNTHTTTYKLNAVTTDYNYACYRGHATVNNWCDNSGFTLSLGTSIDSQDYSGVIEISWTQWKAIKASIKKLKELNKKNKK